MRHHDGTGKENCCCLIFSLLWIIMAYIHCSVMTLKAYNSNNRKKNGPQFVTTFNLMLSNHGTFFMHPTLGWTKQTLLLKAAKIVAVHKKKSWIPRVSENFLLDILRKNVCMFLLVNWGHGYHYHVLPAEHNFQRRKVAKIEK
mgnify:CR=1 FL=1